jgi:hypothetical protein
MATNINSIYNRINIFHMVMHVMGVKDVTYLFHMFLIAKMDQLNIVSYKVAYKDISVTLNEVNLR